MSTLAKAFETTCQLPPSTPQQRLTPPTVLLPATFAILSPQSSSNPAAVATLATGAVAPLAVQHAALAKPLLGHTLASTATATMNLAVGAASPSPSAVLTSHSPYPTIGVQSGSAARESTVSATAAPTLCTGPVRHRCGGSVSGGRERIAIPLLPLYAPTVTPAPAGPRDVPPPRPLHGCPAPLEEDDDCVPLTPASSTDGVSTLDTAQLPAHDGATGFTGPASRTQSCCCSRSGSVATPPLTATPQGYVQAAQGGGVAHPHVPHAINTSAAGSAATVMRSPLPPVTGTPSSSSSALSPRNTPPTMPSHLVAALPRYPFCGVDGVCVICPINTCIETTTTTTIAREEQSTNGLAPPSSLSARQRSQQQQQPQCGTGQRARSRAESGKGALLKRHHAARTHISLQEGPVVMATASAATPTTTTTSAMTTPIASSAGRLTPSSPLFLAPTLYVHGDNTRGLFTPSPAAVSGCSHDCHAALSAFEPRRRESCGIERGVEGEVTPLIAPSRPPTPPCSSDGGSGTASTMPLASFASVNGASAGGGSGCSGGATDPLSECPTRSPSLSQQQQQQHRSMPEETNPHCLSHFHNPHNAYVHSTSTTAAAAAPNAALPGQLTFLPIEVQSAPTMAPFFASLGGGGGAAGAAVLPPANLSQSPIRGPASGRRSSLHDAGHAAQPMPHVEHTSAAAAATTTAADDVLSRSSSTTAAPSASAFFAIATPTRMLASWSASAAPGVVTAILAAPEVSWPAFNIGVDHVMTAVGTSSSAVSSTGQDSGRRSGDDAGRAGSSCAAAVSADTQSPATSLSLTPATSPAPWLYRVGDSVIGGGNGSSDGAFPHSVSLLHGGGGIPAFGNGAQSQLAYSAVPLEDTESACVICLEGHSRPRDVPDDDGKSATMCDATLRSGVLSALDSGGVKPGSQLLAMPCRHCCHQNCLQRWLMESTCCPMCRRDLTQDAILPS